MNAWELLLKARYISNNDDNVESVVEYEEVEDEDGNKVERPKTNRSGNPITYGLEYLLEKLFHDKSNGITKATYNNIKLLFHLTQNTGTSRPVCNARLYMHPTPEITMGRCQLST